MVSNDDELTPAQKLAAKLEIDRNANIGQGPNANGAADAERQVLAEGSHELGGVKKITREELVVDPKSLQPEHVVQQGGGGVVTPQGAPIASAPPEARTPTE
jgi:hypothetical protein